MRNLRADPVIASDWTIIGSLKNEAAIRVFEAPPHVIGRSPFPIDGSGFGTHHLLADCDRHRITSTRSRPGTGDGGAHVERTHGTHLREPVGSLPFGTEAELEVLNGSSALDQRSTDHPLARPEQVAEQRHGAAITERDDAARTPAARVLADQRVTGATGTSLRAEYAGIHPGAGARDREIRALTVQLERLDRSETPAPVGPPVSRSFDHRDHPEAWREAMKHASRRV